MKKTPFSSNYLSKGSQIIRDGGIKNIVFSGGTYQVEVYDSNLKETFWPFLQIDDLGDAKDSFCTCEVAEKEKVCEHLSAAYLKITKDEPLHLRFQNSFWNIFSIREN